MTREPLTLQQIDSFARNVEEARTRVDEATVEKVAAVLSKLPIRGDGNQFSIRDRARRVCFLGRDGAA